MKVVFLDIDGVLSTEQSYFYWRHRDCARQVKINWDRFCPVAVSNLNYLCCEVPDLRIVISSTWRLRLSVGDIRAVMEEDGFKHGNMVVGATPKQQHRGDEILKWVSEWSGDKIDDWVAVDDYAHNIPSENLVQTCQVEGLTLSQVYEIVSRFKPEWKSPVFLM